MKRKKLLSLMLIVSMIMTSHSAVFAEENIESVVISDETTIVEDNIESFDDIESEVNELTNNEIIDDSEMDTIEINDSAIEEQKIGKIITANSKFESTKADLIEHKVLNTLKTMDEGSDYEKDIIIKWTDNEAMVDEIASKYDAEIIRFENHLAVFRLRSMSVVEALALASDPNNDYPAVGPNYIIKLEDENMPNLYDGSLPSIQSASVPKFDSWRDFIDTLGNPDLALKSPANREYQWHHDMINSYAAWSVTKGIPECIVAVVDTGLDNRNADFTEKSGESGNWKSLSFNGAPYPADTVPLGAQSHGTHVAGLISAKQNNGKYGCGVAPNTTIYGYNVCKPNGSLDDIGIIEATTRAVDDGAWIINESLGGPTYSSEDEAAFEYAYSKGVSVFVAMSNDGTNLKMYPAAYDSTIAVVACDKMGKYASFSNYGDWQDLVSPGTGIYSTGFDEYAPSHAPMLQEMSGTSQATPIAAGVGALYASAMYEKLGCTDGKNPILPDDMLSAMQDSSVNGIVNAASLLQADIDKEVKKPSIEVYNNLNELIPSNKLSVETTGYVKIKKADKLAKNVVYTLDGTNPVIDNGEIIKGNVFSASENTIPLLGFNEKSTVTVKAVSVYDLGKVSPVSTVKIKILPDAETIVEPAPGINKVKTITLLSANKITMHLYNEAPLYEVTLNPVFKDSDKNEIDKSNVKYKFSTNKKNVAIVDSTGKITPVGVGSATITCKALDGSNVKKTLSVKVVAGLNTVSIDGQLSVAPGGRGKFSANVPNTGKAKVKLTSTVWSLVNPVAGVEINSRNGSVSVDSSVAVGTTFDVKVEVSDGNKTMSAVKTISVQPKATGVTIKLPTNYETAYGDGEFNPINPDIKKGIIKSINLFSTDIPDSKGNIISTNKIVLNADITGNDVPVLWKSSKSGIAEIDPITGEVIAKKQGKTTITCMLQDGSKKKATMIVNVIVPASSIKSMVHTNFTDCSFGNDTIVVGKKAKIDTILEKSYGKPTINKIQYEYKLLYVSSEGEVIRNTELERIIDENRLLTISKDGKVSLKKGSKELANIYDDHDNMLVVYANTTDGTNKRSNVILDINTKPINKLYFKNTEGDFISNATIELERNDYIKYIRVYCGYEDIDDASFHYFNVESSNPDVAAGMFDAYRDDDGNVIFYGVSVFSSLETGTATLTLKAADGGKGKATLKVTVE